MPSRQKNLSLLAVVACLALAGCGKQLTILNELGKLQRQIAKQYSESTVNVNLHNDSYLTITFINSLLNLKSNEERASRAQQTAVFVKEHYPSIAKLNELWVVFLRQETHYIFVTYSDSVAYFGFDRNARPLPKRKEGQVAPQALSELHPIAVYSHQQDQTDISISRLQLEGNLNSGLAVAPHFTVAGDITGVKRSSAAPPRIVGLDFASYSPISMFPGESRITILSDEKVVYEVTDTFSTSKSADGRYSEFLLLQVPYPAFRRMADGKKLTLRLGDREYRVTDEQLKALREMTSYVKG